MSPVRLRPSFLRAHAKALNDLRELAALLHDAQTPGELIALLQALKAKATTVIVLVDQVLDA